MTTHLTRFAFALCPHLGLFRLGRLHLLQLLPQNLQLLELGALLFQRAV